MSMRTIIPAWLVKVIITTSVSLLISGFSAWGVHLSGKSNDHEKRIAVMEDHQKGIDQSLRDIKAMQQIQSEDTKKILERLPRRP